MVWYSVWCDVVWCGTVSGVAWLDSLVSEVGN